MNQTVRKAHTRHLRIKRDRLIYSMFQCGWDTMQIAEHFDTPEHQICAALKRVRGF